MKHTPLFPSSADACFSRSSDSRRPPFESQTCRYANARYAEGSAGQESAKKALTNAFKT
jgi:hypothetical protein